MAEKAASPAVGDALTKATFQVPVERLKLMVLDKDLLPSDFDQFEPLREGSLENAAMAEQAFPGATADALRGEGRLTGYLKAMVLPVSPAALQPNINVGVATAVHVFESSEAVERWMARFMRQLLENVNRPVAAERRLIAAEPLAVRGFYDRAIGAKAVQQSSRGLFTTTMVAFRVGRLLGTASVECRGSAERRELAQRAGLQLERQIVRVALGS